MSQTETETISIHELPPADLQTTRDIEQDVPGNDHSDARQWESKKKKVCVMLGNAILQLPIWGFAMSYGVFQEYYFDNWTLEGSVSVTGIIGTTSNGVMYISMPFLFALFTRRWARKRQTAALCGSAIMCASFILSSFSTNVWHLVITQGVMAAFGCALIYSPTTLSLGEWYTTSNRAVAYGVVFSCKNIVGSACPFVLRGLLDHYDFRTALRIWAAIAVGTSVLAIFLVPTPQSRVSMSLSSGRTRRIPWHFLQHKAFYIYSIATLLQSSGYGIPQSYLSTYAHEVTLVSKTSSTLLLTLINIPGIASSSFFGYLSDNKYLRLSASTTMAISAVSSALSVFLFWGLTSKDSLALLVLFAITFGFFASGYSACWGGVINEMEKEAAQRNEAIDTGMVYGMLNGARGIGYVSGGLVGVPLLKAGKMTSVGRLGYGTTYGPLIIFTGLSLVFGGWGVIWREKKLLRFL